MQADIFEVQVLPKGAKEYQVIASGDVEAMRQAFDNAHGRRRLVRAGKWPLRPRFRMPKSTAQDSTRHAVIMRYLEHAKARGLESVAVFEGDTATESAAVHGFGLKVRLVPVADFHGPAPAAEAVD